MYLNNYYFSSFSGRWEICFSFNSDLVEIWSFRANSTVRLGKPKACHRAGGNRSAFGSFVGLAWAGSLNFIPQTFMGVLGHGGYTTGCPACGFLDVANG